MPHIPLKPVFYLLFSLLCFFFCLYYCCNALTYLDLTRTRFVADSRMYHRSICCIFRHNARQNINKIIMKLKLHASKNVMYMGFNIVLIYNKFINLWYLLTNCLFDSPCHNLTSLSYIIVQIQYSHLFGIHRRDISRLYILLHRSKSSNAAFVFKTTVPTVGSISIRRLLYEACTALVHIFPVNLRHL